ncbi:MAG: hypothetical protein J1F02_09225 [Lachnospiraceae bacterium]|nr:hypothetical protein [Lachnospiraceae bacterium]
MFLSLTGILIFALLGTLLETARYTVCHNHAARTLRMAAEGLLTEYSRPLYENYGLFFMESAGTPYETVMAEYIGDTLEAAEKGDTDFLQGQLQEIQVTEKTYSGDNEAEALQQQVNQYMGRRVTKEQLSKLREQSQAVANTDTQAKEIEKTVEEQKELAELDEQLLVLMRLVDGISVARGKISCENEFIKMFATGAKKSQNFGITEPVVWEKMKGKLDDTPASWSSMKKETFLAHVRKVHRLTKQAMTEAEKLSAGYQKIAGQAGEFTEHNRKMSQLVESLSVLSGNEKILAETEEILQQKLDGERKQRLASIWKNYDTSRIVFDYTGINESGGGENPLEVLSACWGDGILRLVCENPDKVSEKQAASPDTFAKLYGGKEPEPEDYGGRVTKLAEEEVSLSGVAGELGDYAMDEFCLDSYIQHQFGSYVKEASASKWKTSLQYQWEYIVAGKASDKANLESVLNRILLIRTVANFAAIYKDSGKKSQAYAAAAAIVGFTGLEPLIRLVQTLILIVWSLIEGLVDVAGLLQGRHVPVIKSPGQILTEFPQIFQISGNAITSRAKKFGKAEKKSFGYQEYMLLFLAVTGQSTRRYRIMDMIQWDMIKNGYSEFQLATCVSAIRVKGNFSFPSRFFRLSGIEKMLGRDIQSYSFSCEIEADYL